MRAKLATERGDQNTSENVAVKFMRELDAANSSRAYDLAQGVIDSLGCFESCGDIRIEDNYVTAFTISCGVLSPDTLRKLVLRSKLEVGVVVSHFRRSFVHVALRV